ncbi:hypothetical protein AAFF_G00268040 [Aldrovandia affinis]|uniref:Cyclin B n=1 Tax=Aldrovandia affinis TaxID=143900 RepID=A0AAD7WSV3_9TELE|nr:hypothetical protein AAFF_G00268040 [Aldrovandia affinis]
MEMSILRGLDYNLGRPTPIHFLRRASKVGNVDAKVHALAKYLMELTILCYDLVQCPPSLIAAAAFALSVKVLQCGDWTPILQHYTNYTEDSLVPVMVHIAKMLVTINSGSLKRMTIVLKYRSAKLLQASSLPELSSPYIQNLARS